MVAVSERSENIAGGLFSILLEILMQTSEKDTEYG